EIWKLSPDARPLQFWELLDPKSVGTHVVTQITWGGQIYASVNFISLKSEYTEEIKAEVKASIAKSGAFDVDAQGNSASGDRKVKPLLVTIQKLQKVFNCGETGLFWKKMPKRTSITQK
ncbi:hypothetical protein AVEN_186315-1, partial [Araneus ventricosus]